MSWEQIPLTVLSLTAVYMTTDKREALRKWAPIFGLASQPFWLYAAYVAAQWGILLIACVYTVMWIRGIRNFWFSAA